MGSGFKSAVLEEDTANVIRRWHAGVREKRKKQQQGSSPGQDYSSKTWNGPTRTNSDLSSSHVRTPTFAEITQDFEETTTDNEGSSHHHEHRTEGSPNHEFVRIELIQVTKAEEGQQA